MLAEPIAVTLLVADIFEQLEVPYFVGGSLATAVHGVARSTMDVDIVADLSLDQATALVERLGDLFYSDLTMIQTAIRGQSSFNVIHLATMFKVDVFVRGEQPFDRSQFRRRVRTILADETDRAAFIASPEDNILAKLVWYRQGGEVSDRQWQDVVNVIRIQSGLLDDEYLSLWAANLGVFDLLERVRQQPPLSCDPDRGSA